MHTEVIAVRLSPEQRDLFLEIAEEEGIPAAMLARKWLTDEMKRRKPGRLGLHHEGGNDE